MLLYILNIGIFGIGHTQNILNKDKTKFFLRLDVELLISLNISVNLYRFNMTL